MAAHVPSRLYRSRSQKMIAGVCGGLGEYFDVDPVLIRLMFVVTTFISGAGILAYIILWIVVPFEGGDTSRIDALKRDFEDVTGRVREYMDPPRAGAASSSSAPPPPWGQPAPPPPPGPAGQASQGGQPGQAGPDVTGFHGGFGPDAPGAPGRPSSAASPFDTSREATMTSDSTAARVPGSTDPSVTPSTGITSGPTATADRPETPDDLASATTASTDAAGKTSDETPLEIDPPSGPAPAPGTPPFGTPMSGTPPFGSAPFGPPPGTPPFGAPFSGPAGGPASGPYSAPFGGQAGAPYGTPTGSAPWSSAPRDSGPAFNSSTPPPSERKRRRQHWAGAILILIGMLILGNNLGLLWWVKMQYLMPLLLVGAGAWLLFGRGRRS